MITCHSANIPRKIDNPELKRNLVSCVIHNSEQLLPLSSNPHDIPAVTLTSLNGAYVVDSAAVDPDVAAARDFVQ